MRLRRGWPPWVLDTAVAALAFMIGMVALESRQDVTGQVSGTGELVATAALCLPLIFRRRAPVTVFACIAAISWLVDALGSDAPAGLLAPMFAVYSVARYRPRYWLWPVLGVFAVSAGANVVLHQMTRQDLTAVSALLAAVTFLGMNLRTRRLYLDELEERARRLERERDQQARLATAAERARIARELHDIVAHNLTVMVALADGAAATAPTKPERAAEVMTKVAETGRLALVEMRRMVGVLRTEAEPEPPPTERTPQPGLADLDPLVEQVRAAGMRVELTRSGEPGEWGPGAGLAVYRIVQEALTNTLKHAGPRAVARVRLTYSREGADIEVTDDGAGRSARIANSHGGDGHGLTGMAERATSFGGRLEAGPGAGAGWRVRTRLRFETEGPS